MVIVSQDNNTTVLCIAGTIEIEQKEEYTLICFKLYGTNKCIGKYKTKEMANKVFQELVKNLQHDNPIYYMPEDKED